MSESFHCTLIQNNCILLSQSISTNNPFQDFQRENEEILSVDLVELCGIMMEVVYKKKII